jgi:transposase
MVTGEATTAMVTHAWRVGSRLEECFGSPPAPDAWQDVRRGGEEMARAARRSGGSSSRKGRSSRARSAQLEQLNLNAAGIDVGADAHWVAVPKDRDEQPVRCFGAFTADLYALAEWLRQCQIETVVMESTGVYWIALFEVLEEHGFDVKLVDAHYARQVPGRKTDVKDCQWLQELPTYGLLRGAFRPEDEVCVLRSYLRQRSMLVAMASRTVQHMQKALEQMNLKLTEVVSDITGKTGMTIIRAILAGERDPQLLATYRDKRCKHDHATIAKALTGHWRAEHLFALQQAVEQYDFIAQQLRACDGHIEGCLQAFVPDVEIDVPQAPSARTWRSSRSNPLSFEVQAYLNAMTGVDLTQIDGIDSLTALKVISEIGLDMTCWPTSKHFASWLGLCPGNKISGGKRYRIRSKPSANRAATALRLAAQGLANSHSALGAYYRRMRGRLGAPKAITATAHKLARLVYSMLRYGTAYVDEGQQAYEQKYRDRVLTNLQRKAKAFGYQLVHVADIDGEVASTL